MLPTCAKCGRDSIEHRNPKIRHEFVSNEKHETLRELKSHADHLVAAIEEGNLVKAQFHANNATSCLNWLIQRIGTLQGVL